MAYVPVTFDIFGMEANARMSFTLFTPGAYWSMGRGVRDSLGLSFNARQLGVKRTSNVRAVEIAGPVLEIRTCLDVTEDPTTLTLFVSVPSATALLEGCCTVSDQTQVVVSLGEGASIEWKGSLFAARLQKPIVTARRVTLTMTAANPGEVVRISLMAASPELAAHWCIAPRRSVSEVVGTPAHYSMSSPSGSTLPLHAFSMDASEIKLVTGTPSSNQTSDTLDMSIETYIECLPLATTTDDAVHPCILLKADCDASVTVTAQVGMLRPRYLMAHFAQFNFDT